MILTFLPAPLPAQQAKGLELKFPAGSLTLEQMWTYRKVDGLVPAQPGVVFCIGSTALEPGARRLAIVQEAGFSRDGFIKLLDEGLAKNDPALMFEGIAPPRNAAFHRQDLDGDEVDEVLLTGSGGAGGTSLLSVFRVRDQQVELLFSDSSRFGFVIFDFDGDGIFQIANPGFEFVVGQNDRLQPKVFKIYNLRGKQFQRTKEMSAPDFQHSLSNMAERSGVPLPQGHSAPILRVFDRKLME